MSGSTTSEQEGSPRAGSVEWANKCIDITYGEHGWSDRAGVLSKARFDIADPKQRLMLLSALATLSGHALADDLLARVSVVPLLAHVANVQLRFSRRLTVGSLSRRLRIDPSTLRRWFAREGTITPERFMRWIRMYSTVAEIRATRTSIEAIAVGLKYSAVPNLRRALRNLTDLTPTAMRTPDGYARFLQILGDEIESRADGSLSRTATRL